MTDLKGWATAKALEAQFRLNELETQHSEADRLFNAIMSGDNGDVLEAEAAMYDLRYQYHETAGRLAVYREVLEMLDG